jgi:TetR/AcrR family transcriptional repressor of nem operon
MGRVSDAKQKLMDAVLELIWTGSYGRTTIDHICERAGVHKGTFYHFFPSKAQLAITALTANWELRRPQFDSLFSPTRSPMERLHAFCKFVYDWQLGLKGTCGCTLGCPLFSLGAEVCTHEQELRQKVQELLGYYQKYLESAIRDAQASQELPPGDAVEKSRMFFAYYQGLLTRARIEDNVEVLREMPRGMEVILGKTQPALQLVG